MSYLYAVGTGMEVNMQRAYVYGYHKVQEGMDYVQGETSVAEIALTETELS